MGQFEFGTADDCQRAADAAAHGRHKQLDKENNLAEFIRGQGVEIYTPDLAAFRKHVQAQYVGSSLTWPNGVLEINATVKKCAEIIVLKPS